MNTRNAAATTDYVHAMLARLIRLAKNEGLDGLAGQIEFAIARQDAASPSVHANRDQLNDIPVGHGCALDNSATAEAFAADVVAFATVQNIDSVTKLIAFFHLARLALRTSIDFRLEPDGRMTLQIEAEGE